MSEATYTGTNSVRNCTLPNETNGRQTQSIESCEAYQESGLDEDTIHPDSGLNDDDCGKPLDSCHNLKEEVIEQPAIFLETQTPEMIETPKGSIQQVISTSEEEAESTDVQVTRDDIENLLAQQRSETFQSTKLCHYQRKLNATKADIQYN